MSPCHWKAGHAGMSQNGDCKGIGGLISHTLLLPAEKIASTEQSVQPDSTSQQAQIGYKSHLLPVQEKVHGA